ncbi:hypothetical protein GJ699_19000 [Duganella sp. FT80W]|uniref:DUF4861 domain-containing protein n=1 Tax=Duganella guangzhouensis TaxID=2666084 RepID=A0A6I2L4J0_9BURK|nr:hypothetical protein [Duganella guangzhouensis]MRW92087.1 hypothetical protein [Duganella guangzhouensis]
MNKLVAVALAAAAIPGIAWAQTPSTTITNDQLSATIALPDAQQGYYRGTRFDWSGVITSLKYQGHEYITPWSEINDPAVSDYAYRGEQIATGTSTTMVGLPEEFASLPERTALGWEAAKPGGTFVKIGVGILRKPDEQPYDHFRQYEIVKGTQWEVEKQANAVTFKQVINDADSGYGYVYTKKVALVAGKATLVLEHTLRNTGSKPISGFVYNHNFMRWDNQTPGPDYAMHFGFDPKPADPLGDTPLAYNGRTVNFTRTLVGKDAIRSLPVGFGNEAGDYDFRFENTRLGIGLRATANQPLYRAVIWGIRSVFAIEPFIRYDIAPGQQFSWTNTYQAYQLPYRQE